jgi:serine beta-lactamase-like protein LACTB, mitochondrial
MQIVRIPVVVCLLALVIAWTPLVAAPLSAAQQTAIASVVRREMERLRIPGLSLAVARDGAIVYSRAFGLADVENQVTATPATRFRTASIAKTLTATAVMKLAEQGKLDLDAPIQRYCPAYPAKPWPVTARQLLTHTAGVRHYQRRGESSGTEHFFTIGQALGLFKDDPLLFEPGTQFGYSTYGYMVLGCALEGAAGAPYDDVMARTIYGPAGMTRTGPDHHFLLIPGRARTYSTLSEREHQSLPAAVRDRVRPGELFNAPLHDTSMKRAAGGLLSTAEDLVAFASAFQRGQLVDEATARSMWTVQTLRGGQPVETPWGPLGIGWFVRQAGGHREIYSSGGQVGARGSLYVYPDDSLVMTVMTNLTNAEIIPMEREVLRVLLPDLPLETVTGRSEE